MRENIIQIPVKGEDGRIYIPDDWYPKGLPPNVVLAENIYMDTSYGFAGFISTQPAALSLEEGSGLYEIVSFYSSEKAIIRIGKFSIINGATLVCNNSITIGDHCMLGWGATITDTWLDPISCPLDVRIKILQEISENALRPYPFTGKSQPVVLEDNCWVGFDAVILPGVTLGRGCIVGSKTVITEDVPPYAVIAGSPAKIIKYLTPNDTDEFKQDILRTIGK